MRVLKIAVLFTLVLTSAGCEKANWGKLERKQIGEYIESLGDTVYVLYPSGLYYIELQKGTGISPGDGDTVYFKYKGAFLDYVQFDSNKPYSVPYKAVLGRDELKSGVDEGLRYMMEGGRARLLTPSSLAYGFEGIWGIIPGHTPLLWTIDLVRVGKGPGK